MHVHFQKIADNYIKKNKKKLLYSTVVFKNNENFKDTVVQTVMVINSPLILTELPEQK